MLVYGLRYKFLILAGEKALDLYSFIVTVCQLRFLLTNAGCYFGKR